MKQLAAMFALTGTLALSGCYDPNAQGSTIVRQIEAAGSGNISTFTLSGLAEFFSNRPELAKRIATECLAIEPTRPANWATTAEGTACHAAIAMQPPPSFTADQRTW